MAWCLVHRHARIAVVTVSEPAAIMTFQRGCVAAPVEKHQHLVTFAERIANRIDTGLRKAFMQDFTANIEQLNFWRFGISCAGFQPQIVITTLDGIVQGFQ